MHFRCIFIFLALFAPSSYLEASSSISTYTNTENVRHIALGNHYAAFATSGGIRIYDCRAAKWRTLTSDNQLPTNDIQNVAFDPTHPDMLWMLGVIGAYEGWSPSLQKLELASINLKTDKVRVCAAYQPAPQAYLDSPPYTMPTYLKIERNRIDISAGLSNLAYDRAKNEWRMLQASPPPKVWAPNVMQGFGPIRIIKSKSRVFLLGRFNIIVKEILSNTLKCYSIPGERYDTQGGWSSSYPFRVKVTSSGISFQEIMQNSQWNLMNYPVVSSKLRSFILDNMSGQIRIIHTIPLTNGQVDMLARNVSAEYLDRLHGGSPTDIAVDGKMIWISTYNFPGIHAPGVSWYDTLSKKWHYAPSDNGLAANMVYEFARTKGDICAFTTNGISGYSHENYQWRTLPSKDVSSIGYPQVSNDGVVSIYTSQILGYTQKPPQNLQILAREGSSSEWVRWQVKDGDVSRWAIGRLDRASRKLDSFESLGKLQLLSAGSLIILDDLIWIMGGIRQAGATGGEYTQPVILQWNRRNDQMKLYSGNPLDTAPAIAETNAIPRTCFLSVGGNLWLWAPYQNMLFRYDAGRDLWKLETSKAAAIYRFSLSKSLWVRTPDGLLYRWSSESGWTKLKIPDNSGSFLGGAIWDGDQDFWFGKIGVMKIQRDQIRFEPGSP
jgi:hypothetical protein